MKKTKIICSIGPVSRKYDVMKSMVENGMNVARINFSHADEIERAINTSFKFSVLPLLNDSFFNFNKAKS